MPPLAITEQKFDEWRRVNFPIRIAVAESRVRVEKGTGREPRDTFPHVNYKLPRGVANRYSNGSTVQSNCRHKTDAVSAKSVLRRTRTCRRSLSDFPRVAVAVIPPPKDGRRGRRFARRINIWPSPWSRPALRPLASYRLSVARKFNHRRRLRLRLKGPPTYSVAHVSALPSFNKWRPLLDYLRENIRRAADLLSHASLAERDSCVIRRRPEGNSREFRRSPKLNHADRWWEMPVRSVACFNRSSGRRNGDHIRVKPAEVISRGDLTSEARSVRTWHGAWASQAASSEHVYCANWGTRQPWGGRIDPEPRLPSPPSAALRSRPPLRATDALPQTTSAG